MASEVDICNLALGHLGDNATVASLEPPEGSAQAEHCARFYPIARDALQEMHSWNFCTQRANMALLDGVSYTQWKYVYAEPSGVVSILAVLPPDAANDYSAPIYSPYTQADGGYHAAQGMYTPLEFSVETDATGRTLILTNQEDAVLRYTGIVTDTTKFTPLFVMALSWQLASMLAGPILKGDVGAAEAKRCEGQMMRWLGKAMESDANDRRIHPRQSVAWMVNR
jgi:hypothetical protein